MSETKALTQVWRERGGIPLNEEGREQGYCAAMHDCATQLEFIAATHLAPQDEPSEAIRSVAYGYMPGMGGKMLADSIQNFINAERERISALLVGKGEK